MNNKDVLKRFDEEMYPSAIFEGSDMEMMFGTQKMLDAYFAKIKSFLLSELERKDYEWEQGLKFALLKQPHEVSKAILNDMLLASDI